ncbi:phage tail spike protein [Blautia luti]|uniref:phage tail spike protein n=1 Tax=Blautia luti TaxID=89014 RepID=UPI001FC88DBB|nr:phage tail spike protein [Blautia luti]
MDLYNDSHEKVCILSGIKETCITSTLKTGDKEITFEFRKTNRYATDIKEEGYIRTDTDEFVIKQVEPSGEWYKCTGTLNVEELEGKQYPQGFETVEKTVDECLTEAIDGTGWKVIRCDVSKKRTIRIEQNCSAWDVAQQAITTYRCEMVFDSLNKGISVYEKYGEDRGAYFIERLNLKRLQVQSNSYDFATRLIPIGKDGLMLNIDGKNYVENHQYSKKVKTMTWKDERYTDAESLKEDAEAKLDELSKPYRSYTAEIINLVETKKCLTATEEANKIIISQSGLDAILAAVKDYYERIRELETDININVDGGTPKSTDLLLVKGGTPFTTDYDKYIAGTSHTI